MIGASVFKNYTIYITLPAKNNQYIPEIFGDYTGISDTWS